MQASAELLEYIYQNTGMGLTTIPQILEISKDEELKRYLSAQLEKYQKIHQEAEERLKVLGEEGQEVGKFEKIRAYLMINMETLTDKSTSHIAEMMIQGSTMGVIQAIQKSRDYQGTDPDVCSLMKKLQKIEEDNIEQLKKFL